MELKASYKDILKIAAPLILANMISGVGQIIDTAFINRVGEKELNGTVIGGMVWMFFSFILMGVSSYVQRLVAKKIGEKQDKQVGNIIDNVSIIGVFILLVIITLFFLLRFAGLDAMLKDPEIVAYTFEYLDVLILYTPILIAVSFLSAFFSAVGKTAVITRSVVVYILVNLILDYILIFGNFGFPKLGVNGSGIATGIALTFGCINYLYYVYKYQIIKEYNLFKFNSLNRGKMLHIVLKSVPLVLQNIFNMLAYWIFFVMIEKMGSAELRVSLIVRSLYLFLCLPVFGLGRAVNTVVSNFIGRKDVGNLAAAIRKSHQVALGIGVILCALVYFFPAILLNIYTNDIELINEAIPILNVLIVSLFLFSVSTVNTNIIIATGKTSFVFVTGVVSIVGYLAFAYVSIFIWNEELPFIWLSDWANWSIFTVMSSLYILIWWKKQKDVFIKSKISLAE